MVINNTKKVKIVATIGPATDNAEAILKLGKEGVDVFRLNLSHRKKEESLATVKLIREAEKALGKPLAIMGDLAGLKIRIGNLENETAVLEAGQKVMLRPQTIIGNAKEFSINFPEILQGLEKGAEVYLDDGFVKLEVIKKEKDGVMAKVTIGGQIRSRVGFSAQGLKLNKFFLTPKDKEDIKTMLLAGADALAISFVQTAKDVDMVKKLLPANKRPMLIAKIETRAGVENAEKILETADGIMVARGDLGLAVPLPEIPHIQKHLIKLALKQAKPVITATQMLESMTNSHMPTRAEVTDVANAILDGTDAVMLSGETARGKYPHETIRIMRKIIERATAELAKGDFPDDDSIADAVSASAAKIADQIKARLVIVFTQTGSTARRIARHHHSQPILALSPSIPTIHELNFSWGVYPQEVAIIENVDDLINVAKRVAQNNPIVKLKKGEPFVISAGIPFGKSGTTNLVLIQKI